MRTLVERATIVGLSIAAAIAIGGCQNAALGEPCLDGWCLDGMKCQSATVNGQAEVRCVVPGVCGNGVPDPGEACDDGNTASGDGCSANCRSNEECGNNVLDPGEICDDGNTASGDGCSADCSSDETCGNSVIDEPRGETCDPPRPGRCDQSCHVIVICGNDRIDPGEECDDGMENNNDNGDCRTDCIINRCGDGFVDMMMGPHHEDCEGAVPDPDDLHKVKPVETAECNLDCTIPSCGDGKVNSHFTPPGAARPEVCDDGNPTCGSCSEDCQTVTSAKATGVIIPAPGSEYRSDGSDKFTIDDGVRSVTFQFTNAPAIPPPNVAIPFGDTNSQSDMASKITVAIQLQALAGALLIDAVQSGGSVQLTQRRATVFGNQTIMNNVRTTAFVVGGMDGGEGGDCESGQTCKVENDCQPQLVCRNNTCVAP